MYYLVSVNPRGKSDLSLQSLRTLIIMTYFTGNCGHITLSEPENCVSFCHSKGTILAYLQKYLI